jgi:hypothetical protein
MIGGIAVGEVEHRRIAACTSAGGSAEPLSLRVFLLLNRRIEVALLGVR